ncbi:MAG: CDP-alcohol phosphatidyltransferase family protein [Anaerolineae bacterium]|nr:MAG: CDP-alcohol phosphatidyltransferase family protein [Anaerolineae bacterium]
MASTKTLADLLTAVRFCLAGFILWLGVKGGAEALPAVVVTLILCWLTDLLDGPLARRDPSKRRTWIGDRDLEVDMSVGLAVLAYLTLAGYLALKAAIGYVVVCAAMLWYFWSPQLGWAVQAPPYAGMIYTALRNAPRYGLMLVAYVALLIVATWPRFPRVMVPQFLEGMRNLGRAEAADEAAPVELEAYLEDGNGNGHRWRPS